MEKPKIICICGSTKFYKETIKANYDLTMQGYIVLAVGFYSHTSEEAHGEVVGITPEQKIMLDELHMRKIDLCDEVYVINYKGYIGKSTKNEIDYAKKLGKPIKYMETSKENWYKPVIDQELIDTFDEAR